MANSRISSLCLAVFLFILHANQSKAYDTIYAFGDSLSDVGNVFSVAGSPSAPYYLGRASNGPLWVEDLSQQLNLGPVTPSLTGGKDFAFAGAATGPGVPGMTISVPPIGSQVAMFTAANGGAASQQSLYTIGIGSIDVLAGANQVFANPSSIGQVNLSLENASANEVQAMHALALEGAKNFLVLLVPDLGKIPDVTANAGKSAIASQLSQTYNNDLLIGLSQFSASSHVRVDIVDLFSLMDRALAFPAAFGFSNVTNSCYSGPRTGGGVSCSDPNRYFFWDGAHPTSAGQQLIANAAFAQISSVPGPVAGTGLPLLSGLLAFGFLLRRRAA